MSAVEPTADARHLGLDLGATNLKWCVLEHGAGGWRMVDCGQIATRIGRAEELPDAIVAQLSEVGRSAAEAHGPLVSVGIGIPGLYDPAAGSTRFLVNVPGPWAGHPVAPTVGAALGLPACLINDARAFGVAELAVGAGRGVRTMIGLTLGSGVGGVFAVRGRVELGHDGTGGELGHQTIDPDGPLCNCGNRGCLESFARADQISALCGTATVADAVVAARSGDSRAMRGLAEVGRYLGIGIGNAITILSPDRVVIGGGVAGALDLFLPAIHAELRRRVHVTSLEPVEIVPAELGIWAGSIGAALHGAEQAGFIRLDEIPPVRLSVPDRSRPGIVSPDPAAVAPASPAIVRTPLP